MYVENALLLGAEIFRGLDQVATDALMELVELRQYEPNEVVFSEGDVAACAYYLIHGHVRLMRSESVDREADIFVCEPGDMFGEYMSAGERLPHAAKTVDSTQVAVFDLIALRDLAARNSRLQENLIRIISATLVRSMNCIAADRLHTAAQRVGNYFLSRCPASATEASFRLPFQKWVLAGKLGLGPEALSRAFATLANAGVDVRGRTVTIDSVSRLKEACL